MTSLGQQPALHDLDSVPSIAALAIAPRSRVIVSGSGAAELARALGARDCRVVAVEEDKAAVEVLRPVCEEVLVGRLDRLSEDGTLVAGSAQAVALAGNLDRAGDPVALLRAAAALTEPGGRIVASVPNATHGAARLRLLRGELPLGGDDALEGPPARLYDRAAVERLATAAGLSSVELVGVRRKADELAASLEVSDLSEAAIADAWSGEDASTTDFVLLARAPGADADAAEPSLVGRHRKRIVELEAALAESESSVRALTAELAARDQRVAELERAAREASELESVLRERMAELEEASHALKLLRHDLLVKERYIAELRAAQAGSRRAGLRRARPEIASLRPTRRQRLVSRADRSLRRIPAAHRLARGAFRAARRALGGRSPAGS
jgi:hypothetical protein